MIDRLSSLLQALSPLSPSLDAAIRERLIKETFKRGHIIASPGRRANAIWYIVSGLAKEYYYEESGKVMITAFWMENELMFNAESLFGKRNSLKYIELIEDSILLTMDGRQAHQLHALYPETRALSYAILAAAKRKDNERGELLVLNARESNRHFCRLFPWGRISVNDAASYLGLSRRTITAIRSKR
jgi:CRP-like cAMP-binding protein